MTELDEKRLVEKLNAGNRDACAELIDRHYQIVYRFLARLTRDVHWAEDLTQETFAAAWAKTSTFRGHSSLATWLHRIAYTKFIDSQRAAQRAQTMRQRRTSSLAAPANPLDSLRFDDEAKLLNDALDQLEDSYRTVLLLHYLQGLSYREMAMVLDEPTGTVKWRTQEALKRVRLLLGDEDSDYAAPKATEPRPIR